MDIKTSTGKYPGLGFTGDSSEIAGRIRESIRVIKESGIPHHFRTTVVPGFVDAEVIEEILELIGDERNYVLQGFRPGVTYDPAYSELPAPTPDFLESLQKMFTEKRIECELRYNN